MSDVKLNGVVQQPVKLVAAAQSPPNPRDQQATADAEKFVVKPEDLSESLKKAEAQESKQKSQSEVESAVTKLNDYVQTVQRDLQFNLDNDSGKTVITVVDRKTSNVIRQIPDDVALKLAQNLQQDEPLSLFNAKV